MTQRGPKPKPEHLKVLAGSRVRPTASIVMTSMKRLPPAPSRYDAASLSLWKSLGHKLLSAGALAETDGIFLEVLVDAWVAYENARATSNARAIEKAAKWALTCLKECGLTPASRRGVQSLRATGKAKPDPAARYFEG